ncbi:MAG TPA: ABC transporter ATP-binding protein [Desulfotomaculum sp.]|nr:MAG: ABC transporter [Peptococcaceae bacterium BRH_c8a]KJS78650.1 MAG: ABC transporter [Desulfotomaculum sp. BICA1-6]HBX22135.1 ABC transporter ATP-binding protein [Desulfotomaculum sp.]
MSSNDDWVLEVRDLMVFYENALAVNNISLKCRTGQITGIFGANSAGKSTLMHTISGVMLDIKKKEAMTGGERITLFGAINFNEEDIQNLQPHKRARKGIVLCPERRQLFTESSALENLKIGGYLADKAQAKKTLAYIFQLFPELQKLKNREAGFLSGGEQQMIAIGRALMAQPKMLLLDEPLLGLAPSIETRLAKAINEIKQQTGITILLGEQYARPVLPIIDYGYVLENGSIVMEGTAEDLMNNPDVLSAYFGM